MQLRLGVRYLFLVFAAFVGLAAAATAVRAVLHGQWLVLIEVAVSWLFAGWIAVIALRSIRQLRAARAPN